MYSVRPCSEGPRAATPWLVSAVHGMSPAWVHWYACMWLSSAPCSSWQVWEGQLAAAQRDAITAFLNRLKYDAVAHVDEVSSSRRAGAPTGAIVRLLRASADATLPYR